MKNVKIGLSIEEIRQISKQKYLIMLKEKTRELALTLSMAGGGSF